jgi:hypothetical protein
MILIISPGYWGYDMCYCFIMCDQGFSDGEQMSREKKPLIYKIWTTGGVAKTWLCEG